ncbi:MAG: hypothetical protein SFZ23_12650 [Planctomycetota bacterium]|nr:hypothetical protein [Planctomycetota bacterium]
MQNYSPRPNMPEKLPLHPRRVRGGVRLASGAIESLLQAAPAHENEGAGVWATHRLLRLLEQAASGDVHREGMEYARLGQTRRISFEPGAVTGAVQGRAMRAYQVSIKLSVYSEQQWGKVVEAMASQAVHSARLLAGELPPGIEDAFAPVGIRLVPTLAEDLQVSCTCGHAAAHGTPWCKHVCCLCYLFADRLRQEPFLIFKLRGMPVDDVLESLRQRRAVSSAAGGLALACMPRVAGLSDESQPLEQDLSRFWEPGPELAEVDAPLSKPDVPQPLLRRLGPSPFEKGRFPLVGLLATCYDVISARAAGESAAGEESNSDSAEEPSDEAEADEHDGGAG